MKSSVRPLQYSAVDLRGAEASLALEGLVVTAEDTQEALAVMNGALSWGDYVRSLRRSVKSLRACGTFPPYTYPNSSVLLNRFDLQDARELETIERKITYTQLGLLSLQVIGRFDVGHLKRIHYQLFHELYEWAGQFRNVDMGKDRTLFCRAAFLDQEAHRILGRMATWAFQPISHAEQMAQRGGELLADLNMLHPFRDGNGRTQREFVRQWARFHGFRLDYQRLDADRYMASSITDDARTMAAALRGALQNAQPDRSIIISGRSPRRSWNCAQYQVTKESE